MDDHATVWAALYESGVSTTKLAAEFGTYPNTIRRALLAAGVQMRSSSRRYISAQISEECENRRYRAAGQVELFAQIDR